MTDEAAPTWQPPTEGDVNNPMKTITRSCTHNDRPDPARSAGTSPPPRRSPTCGHHDWYMPSRDGGLYCYGCGTR